MLSILLVVAVSVIPIQVAMILPPFISGISHYLRGAGLTQWLNITISLFALVIIAVFCAWITDGFTTDLRQSTMVVFSFITLIAGGKEMIDLFSYLEMNPSPLLAIVPAVAASKSETVPVLPIITTNTPKPLILSGVGTGGNSGGVVSTFPTPSPATTTGITPSQSTATSNTDQSAPQ